MRFRLVQWPGNLLYFFAETKVKRGAMAAVRYAKKTWQWVKENIQIDGPGRPGTREKGRIFQIRFRRKPVFRVDYHPIPGSQGRPKLHYHRRPI